MARAKPKFSIITTCKGRLEHLKQTLPAMLAQKDSEVIVVDYSCPDGTGDYVRKHFPDAKVVHLENLDGFSNWRGRNAGAAEAEGDYLIFCDADIRLARGAVGNIARAIDEKSFGLLQLEAKKKFVDPSANMSLNQLRGFHVVPTKAFKEMEGYDTAISGYAAGADTEFEARLRVGGFEPRELGAELIDEVIAHGDRERVRFHSEPVGFSYAAGLWYRRAKLATMLLNRRTTIGEKFLDELARISKAAAIRLIKSRKPTHINVIVKETPLRMPAQLGLKNGKLRITMKIEIIPGERLTRPAAGLGTQKAQSQLAAKDGDS